MEVIESHLLKVFRKDYEGRTYYKVGISKKDQNGNYVNGYLDVRFKKDVELEDRTNIYIKKAWIDFYLKDKKTIPYIFINEFDTVHEAVEKVKEEIKENKIDPYEEMGKQVKIDACDMSGMEIIDSDSLPF